MDDELAKAATEFSTLDELREEIESRLGGQLEAELDAQFRAAVVDALVDATELDVAEGLVQARAVELWNALVRSLERRGISAEAYLQLSNRSPRRSRPTSRKRLAAPCAEIVLEGAADQLGIEVSDEEIDELIREQADDPKTPRSSRPRSVKPAATTRCAPTSGCARPSTGSRPRSSGSRSSSRARDKLWTPRRKNPRPLRKLWTPGSKEPA